MYKKDTIEAEMVEKAFKKYASKLTPKEMDIISRYYGIGKNVRHNLQELGEIYQVTRERIRQIKFLGLCKLKLK